MLYYVQKWFASMVHIQSLLYLGPPSPPMNLQYTVISTTTDNVFVRLDWDPPMNNGGVTITNYLIFVNGSQEVGSNCTNVTLTLNSTGQHFLQINAVNDCGLVGDISSVIVSGTCSAIGLILTILYYCGAGLDTLLPGSHGTSESNTTIGSYFMEFSV